MKAKFDITRATYQIKALKEQNKKLELVGTIEAKKQIARNETKIFHIEKRIAEYMDKSLSAWDRYLSN